MIACCTYVVQVVGPLSEGETFSADDFAMLVQFETSSHAHAVAETLEGLAVEGISPDEDTSAFRSLLVLKVSSLLRSQPRQRRIPIPQLKHKHRCIAFSVVNRCVTYPLSLVEYTCQLLSPCIMLSLLSSTHWTQLCRSGLTF